MPARLLIKSGQWRGKVLILPPQGKVVLGRSKEAGLVLPDINLSRAHCALSSGSGGHAIEDLNSTNGTLVNGRRISSATLEDGDVIMIGETELEFRIKERFEDGDTATDLPPVAPKASAQKTSSVPADAGVAPHPGSTKIRRVKFCDICDVNVPRSDLDAGIARELAGNVVCSECMGRLNSRGLTAGANIAAELEAIRREVKRGRE